MLDLLGAGLMAFGIHFGHPKALKPTDISVWLNTTESVAAWSEKAMELVARMPDPQAEAIVRQYLQTLVDQGNPLSGQGLLLQVGGYPVLAHQADRPLPAASLTKVATTIAALATWKPDHQFETVIAATGPVQNGVVQGDLIVQSQGDPLFVWEEAIALGNALQQAGVQRVAGNLLVTPAFTMNFVPDPIESGYLLRQAVDAQLWSGEIIQQYSLMPPGTPQPQVTIEGEVILIDPATAQAKGATLLVRHRSLPLAGILKSMNIYSNNEMSEQLAQLMGGSAVVAAKAAEIARVPPGEIRLINGSGLGVENLISPRAVAAMFIAIQDYLQPLGLNVADLFPVSGRDGGTLDYRDIPKSAAVKTGTLNTVSALAGALPTRDRGIVWFVIQNQGTDIEGLRIQQDILLQALTQHWEPAQPLPADLNPHALNREIYRLGAPSRNQVL